MNLHTKFVRQRPSSSAHAFLAQITERLSLWGGRESFQSGRGSIFSRKSSIRSRQSARSTSPRQSGYMSTSSSHRISSLVSSRKTSAASSSPSFMSSIFSGSVFGVASTMNSVREDVVGVTTTEQRPTLRLTIASTLLRGVGLAEVLSRIGHHFANNACDVDCFELSERTCFFDLFYSHSWRDSRWAKIVALCCTHNSSAAFRVSMAFSVTMCILQRFSIVPSPWPKSTWHVSGEEIVARSGCWCFFRWSYSLSDVHHFLADTRRVVQISYHCFPRQTLHSSNR